MGISGVTMWRIVVSRHIKSPDPPTNLPDNVVDVRGSRQERRVLRIDQGVL